MVVQFWQATILYHKISEELKNILNNFDKNKPWFIRYEAPLVILSFLLFFIIEIFLK